MTISFEQLQAIDTAYYMFRKLNDPDMFYSHAEEEQDINYDVYVLYKLWAHHPMNKIPMF